MNHKSPWACVAAPYMFEKNVSQTTVPPTPVFVGPSSLGKTRAIIVQNGRVVGFHTAVSVLRKVA